MASFLITSIALVKRYWIFLTLFLLTVITTLSLVPLKELPPTPSSDKVNHIIAYGALMFPVAIKKPQRWQVIALLLIGWSGAIELLQPYINRYGEWQDLLANIAGIVFGWLLAELLTKFSSEDFH
ncbi:MAG: VanZ family protein [Cyanobacteria bacterium P01_G01_bin.19]